jgi:hypothetical protein
MGAQSPHTVLTVKTVIDPVNRSSSGYYGYIRQNAMADVVSTRCSVVASNRVRRLQRDTFTGDDGLGQMSMSSIK